MDTDEDALNVETLKRTAKVAGHRLKVANWGKGKIIRGKIIEGIANLRSVASHKGNAAAEFS